LLPDQVLRLAGLHRIRQQQLAVLVTRQFEQLWRAVDAGDPQAAWATVATRAAAVMTAAQTSAATGAQAYVDLAVTLQGVDPDVAGAVPPAAFAGTASDGRPLTSLLSYPAFEVSAFLDQGMDSAIALAAGGRHLIRIGVTQVQDAARVATGVAIVNNRRTRGYIRVVTPPSCSRCTILAGRWYAYRASFARHPHCDCTQAPAVDVEEPQSPRAIYDAMTAEQRQAAGWNRADQKAIDDGADLYQVTNAHRDLRSMQVAGRTIQTTLHGATRRGIAGKRLEAPSRRRAVRLTPEAIYAEAERLGWSRDETIRQLQRHGYII
jgi:hypothetical protein